MSKVLFRICLVVLLCSSFGAAACEGKTEWNIPYRDSGGRCVLDVSYNKKCAKEPVIVWFHGGGLTGGEKYIPEGLQGRKCVVVSVEYRLYPEASVAEIIDDAAAAVAWVVGNIGRYGGDVRNIVLTGHSAGAYLVSMLALDKHYLARYDVDPDSFALIAPLSGQMITHFTERAARGIDQARPVVDSLAPMYHIRKDAPPFLLVTGDREKEMICRYEENAYFCALMKHIGHPSIVLHELPGCDHSSMVPPGIQLLVEEMKL